MSCSPINILVIDAESREMWYFEGTYANQGRIADSLIKEVNYQSFIPANTIKLANQLLDMYEIMHQFTKKASGRVAVGFEPRAEIHASAHGHEKNLDLCEDYAMSSALSDAFSGAQRAKLKIALQRVVNKHPNQGAGLITTKLHSESFSISTAIVSIGGKWQRVHNPKFITKLYGPDNPNGLTQVSFTPTMTNGLVIKMALNEDLTVFDGMPLNILKEQRTSSRLIKKCLADTLDAMYPKLVTGSGRTSPSFNNVALVDGGQPSGSGRRTEICKHTYYINSVEGFSFQGQCPN